MKRLVSFLLILAVICSLAGVVYASSEKEIAEHHYTVLKSLGIIQKSEEAEYDPFADVSKSSFINYICNIIGEYGYTESHNAEAISILEANGIIHKGQNDLNKPLYYNEAVTMVVRLLGYEEHAQNSGGFPAGYLSIANRLGLADGIAINSGERMNEAKAATLLYNAINCPYVEIAKITEEDGIIYGNTSEDTLLYEYRRIYRVDGVVEAAGGVSASAYTDVDSNKVMIDGYVYETESDCYDMLGMNVEAYIRDNKQGTDKIVVAIPYDNEVLEIYDEFIVGPSDNYTKFRYIGKSDKEEAVNISSVAAVMYNGQLLDESFTPEKFCPKDGSVKMIDNKPGNGYDIVFINDYKTMVTESVSPNNRTVKNLYSYDEKNLYLNYEQTEDRDIKLFRDGEEASFTSLKTGDVLRILQSVYKGKTLIRVYVSDEKITGVVTALHGGDDETVITVGGAEYITSPSYEAAVEAKDVKATGIVVGGSYSFHLDNTGRIAYVEKAQDAVRYGIVVGKTAGVGVFDKEYSLKLYTTEGDVVILPVDEKIEYNGTRGVVTESVIDSVKSGGDGVISVVGYRVNSDGKINMLETPQEYNDGNNGEFNVMSGMNEKYRYANTSFDSKAFIDDGAVLWQVAGSLADEDSYSVASVSELMTDHSYPFSCYNIDEFGFAKQFVIQQDSTFKTQRMKISNLLLVEDVGTILSSEGEEVFSIKGMMGEYDTITLYCEDDSIASVLRMGDTISPEIDSKGYITDYNEHYSLAREVEYVPGTTVHTSGFVIRGTVVKNNVAGLRMKIKGDDGVYRSIRTSAALPVAIYDTQTDEVIRGSLGDIEQGDIIITKLNSSKNVGIVVYR